MICKSCSAKLPENSIYCNICGKKQIVHASRHRRRSNAEGCITKMQGHRANPYWARMPADYSSGKPTRKSIGTFPTYKAASEALAIAIYIAEAEAKSLSESTTLQNIYDQFTQSHYFCNLGKNAQASHRSAWKHLKHCSTIKIEQINKETFQKTVNTLHDQGYKRETLAKIRNLASLLCKEAMGQGLLTVNFGRLIQLPKADTVAPKPFSSNDLKTLWHSADGGNADAMAVLILSYTGMRPSELLSVDISIHLHKKGMYWYFQNGSKTDAGMSRIIPIPQILHNLILHLIDNRTQGPLIASKTGGFFRLDNWRPRHFNTLMTALSLTGYTPYACRHTYADLQKRRNISPEIMMEIMGHEDYSTTVERYQTTTDEDIIRICSSVDGMERPS